MSDRGAARLAWALVGLSVLFVALAAVFGLLAGGGDTEWGTRWGGAVTALAFLAFPIVGAILVSKRGGGILGWLFLGVGVTFALGGAAGEYAHYAVQTDPGSLPAGRVLAWIADWLWVPTMGLAIGLILLFPDGRLPSPGWRWLLRALIATMSVAVVGIALTPGPLAESPFTTNPFGVERAAGLFEALSHAQLGVFVFAAVAAFALVRRYRRSHGEQRVQIKWFVTAGAVVAALFLVPAVLIATGPEGLVAVSQDAALAGWALLPVAALIAVLKYRLYDIDVVINRSLVYGALTLFVLAVYAGLLAAVEAVFSREGAATSLLAAAVVAVAFAPAKERLQRGVDRMLYGERRDPYRALSQLGARLEAALTPEDVLPAIVEAVTQSLRLPYAAVELRDEDGPHVVASSGTVRSSVERVPLQYRGELVGELAVGLRPGESEFSPADRKLLADLARQAGVAAHAVALTRALQRSRERLVTAREEERRRLRRDLHDGLGPALAGITLQLEVARNQLGGEPAPAREKLLELRAHTQAAIADIRRLVHDLRPPALDELGLLGALREQAARLDGRLRVTVDGPGSLPELPAAVEVAAYRIGLEALTNVVRHANAHACTVRVSAAGALELEIADDGEGLAPDRRAGVGLGSMRERAAELGGTCTIAPGRQGGTRVVARLPLRTA
jgi:two-component system, NarL family, sensor kinase